MPNVSVAVGGVDTIVPVTVSDAVTVITVTVSDAVPVITVTVSVSDTDMVSVAVGGIVDGIIDNRDEIDEQITTHARDWSLARMPAVDRALLRIGVWEILYNDEVPTAVAIDEAVELAKEYSTDDSGSFVHGILARVARSS